MARDPPARKTSLGGEPVHPGHHRVEGKPAAPPEDLPDATDGRLPLPPDLFHNLCLQRSQDAADAAPIQFEDPDGAGFAHAALTPFRDALHSIVGAGGSVQRPTLAAPRPISRQDPSVLRHPETTEASARVLPPARP